MMHILSCEEISKSIGEKVLFDGVTLHIDDGDKLGLIGVNGTGKSTLLKIIAGTLKPDSGTVEQNSKAVVRYLPQTPEFLPEATVLEEVFRGSLPVMVCLGEYEATVAQLAKDPQNQALQQQLTALTVKMDELDGWSLESEAKTALTELGIQDFSAKMGTLSGGQRKRVALAGALIQPCDLLILDEPTNHIDSTTVGWLEQFLNRRKGALLLVTHDRYFLDRVVGRMLELDGGKLYSYQGNYSSFLELKALRLEQETASEEKRQNLLRRELAWIRRGAQARSTKQKARIERFEELKNSGSRQNGAALRMEGMASRLGKTVIEIEHVAKHFASQTILDDFSYTLLRHDRIGIIGPNGRGKSTLLNMIAGRLAPDAGKIRIGQTVKIGYFSQETTEMDGAKRVIEYIEDVAPYVQRADGSRITAAQLLEQFLFPRSQQWTPLEKLSGGERRRLQLLRILIAAPNVLLLDEPTNDLDIQTLTILEEYLDAFDGAVLAVSHDRYFLDKMAERIFAFEGEGRVDFYSGNYSDYEEKHRQSLASEQAQTAMNQPTAGQPTTGQATKSKPPREKTIKLTFQEQKEYDGIEDRIAEAEAELSMVSREMEGAGSEAGRLQELFTEQQRLTEKLDKLMERWTYLSEIAEKSGE